MYTYNISIVRVIDGDTLVANFDLGMHVHIIKEIRMLDYNAPEMFQQHAKTKAEAVFGALAKDRLVEMLSGTSLFMAATTLDKTDKYGRVLATIAIPGHTTSLNEQMRAVCRQYWVSLHTDYPEIYPEVTP